MPFDPNLSSDTNPHKKDARAGFALARFAQVLANFFKRNAYFRVLGTLSYHQKHLVPAEKLSNQISTRLFPCHLTQIYLPPQTLIKGAKGQVLQVLANL